MAANFGRKVALRGADDESFARKLDDFFDKEVPLVARQDAAHRAEEALAHAAMATGDAENGGFASGIFLPVAF